MEFTRSTEKSFSQIIFRLVLPKTTYYVQNMHVSETSATTKVANPFEDDVPLTSKQVAEAMRVSRWTIYRWRCEGYVFEFGRKTTFGHLKAWLRGRVLERQGEAEKAKQREDELMGRLRAPKPTKPSTKLTMKVGE